MGPSAEEIFKDYVQTFATRDKILDQQHYFELFNEAPVAYAIIDRNGIIEEINIAGTELFGLSKGRLCGQPMLIQLELSSRRRFLDHMLQCRHSDNVVTTELVVRNRQLNKNIPVLMTSVSLGNSAKSIAYRTAIIDLSEKKRMDDLLARTQRLAMMGTFVAGIAHEINNPLNTVTLTAQVTLTRARKEGRSAEEIEMLTHIVEQVVRCGEIVRNLSHFAKQEQTEKRPIDLNKLLGRTVHLSQMYDIRCRVDLSFESGTMIVSANELEIEQVMLNLLKNAAEAKPEGCEIQIASHINGGHAVVEISDNGPGMTREQMGHIFDPFFTTKREKGGTGLGLAIVHAIIRAHDGEIFAESATGGGMKFTISIPLASEGECPDEQDTNH